MFTQVCVLPGAVKLAVFPLSVMIRYLEEQLRGEFSVLQCRYSFKNLYSEAKSTSIDNVVDTRVQITLSETEVCYKSQASLMV